MVQFDTTYNAERLDEIRRAEEESLLRQLATQYGLQYIDMPGITINPEALTTIPEAEARAANVAAFERVRKKIGIAMRNPNRPQTKALLRRLEDKGFTITRYLTSTANLEHAWRRYEDQKHTEAVKRGVLDIDPDHITELMRSFKDIVAVRDHLLNIRTMNSARRVSETLETIFAGALALSASDVHIEPEEAGIRLRYRLDGVLHDVIDLERSIYTRLISRLKLLASMILNIVDEAQDGRFSFTVGEQTIEVRASAIPGAAGESLVMRLLDPSVASFKLANLGLNQTLQAVIDAELARPNGMIVTTGPTGSGKTTALYAFLQEVHTSDRKIITIEDPVEYKLAEIVQTQVSDEYTFATGLRAVLRQDPDVIMVGEIRDREVAETAVHAAQTGHLVFSTLHTNNAYAAFTRLIDLGVDPRSMGSAVNIILGQRLVRNICTHCSETYTATPEETQVIDRILATHPAPPAVQTPYTLYRGTGCNHCNETGFSGRIGIFEAVRMDPAVEEIIIRDPREHMVAEAAAPQGIPSMAADGVEKVLQGVTTLAELERVVDTSNQRQQTVPAVETEEDIDITNHIV
ncbi:MAG TPA: ATPase, T2SS/T4P/T4SS family [Candidatus Paceibacterota bacterium]|nr:ATPase, T2SS/T4P/T4SS family [Candidatus Paceibacterota bacterium]